MRRRSHVFLCNALDEPTKRERNITTDSPAATNKVFALASALRAVGQPCVVLSLGRGRQKASGARFKAFAKRANGVPVIYCAFWDAPLLTHMVTFLSATSLVVAMFWRKRMASLLSYNRSFHYVPALLAARAMGVRSYLDLEDGYIVENKGRLRQFKNAAVRFLFCVLCPDGAMVAARGLASQLNHRAPLVCYGVAETSSPPGQNWQTETLTIMFSGTLLEEAGSRLLLEALVMLRTNYPRAVEFLRFVVTGKGPWAEAFRGYADASDNWLTYCGALPRDDYLKHLRSSHVGLSLRLKSFEMAGTTFPSKVVEYAANGLLVLTTLSSDVPELFGEGALYLESETPEALADMLAGLPDRVSELRRTAEVGRTRVVQACSRVAVGRSMKALLAPGGSA